MANRYWVGGTGDWGNTANWSTSSGGAGGASVPTSVDNVFIDQTGPYTINHGFNAQFFDLTVSAANVTLTGAPGDIVQCFGSMTLAATTVWTSSGTTSNAGRLFFSDGGLNRTINFNGVTIIGGITFNLGTTTATLTGSIASNSNSSQAILLNQGTLNTSASNHPITCNGFVSAAGTTLTLNGSTVTCTGSSGFNCGGTLNAGTSTIVLSDPNATLSGVGGLTYSTVSFTSTALSAASITTGNTFATLSVVERAASGVGAITLSANQTITSSFTVQSGATDPSKRVMFRSNTFGTARTITSASNNLFGIDFQDITAAGAASWTDSTRTRYWGDCKGNTGITFATGRTVYWNLAGAQNWGAIGWALTSTGTPAVGNFPLAQDIATFTDAGSVTGTITINSGYNIGTLNADRTSAMTLDVGAGLNVYFYGNFTLRSGVTVTGGGTFYFAGRTSQSIASGGKTLPQPTIVTINTTFVVNDAYVTTGAFTLNGSMTTLNNVTAASLTNTGTINSNFTTFTLTGTGTVWSNTGVVNTTTNTNIVLSDNSTTSRLFAGGGGNYQGNFTIGGATSTSTTTITGANTFGRISSTKTVAHGIQFAANQTIGTWSVTGSAGNLVSLFSNNINAQRTLTITNRTSGIDYLDVQDITANLTPVTFYAGANSRLRSNVLGVAAKAPASNEFIYVLASGTSWTVPANWNNVNNEIHLFAGGGGGASSRQSGTNRAGGGGGGGGGYTKVTNLTLTPSASVSYAIGSAGSGGSLGFNGNSGGNTTFNSGTYTTTGGGGGQAATTPSSTGGTAGTGSTFNGGVGGVGSTSTVSDTGNGGGGGAGAGGPLGAGRNGGTGFTANTQGNIAGGGGGGNGGGSVGGNASSGTPGTGGNNNAGVGGGIASSGFNGGGGAGAVGLTSGFQGGGGIDISNAGIGGGGGGGGGADAAASIGALFGGGGGGGGIATNGAQWVGQTGGQGGIVIWYSVPPPSNGNFFFLFG